MATPVYLITRDAGLLRHWHEAAARHPSQEAALDWQGDPGALVLLDIDMKDIPDWSNPWWAERTRSMRVVALSTTPLMSRALLHSPPDAQVTATP